MPPDVTLPPQAPAAEPAEPPETSPTLHGRAGRNLPAAIAVGAALGALALTTLYAYKPIFVGVVIVAIACGCWEVARSLRVAQLRVPVVPLLAGTVAMELTAYRNGPEHLVVALLLTVLAIFIWRLPDGADGYLPDVSAGIFAAVYVPFLAGFAALIVAPPDGPRRATIFIATVVANDVGGYAAGVLFGKHPMAPSVSPKKSWEGFVGSTIACMACGAILMTLLLNAEFWQGIVVGLAIVCSATLGDLAESMIKRDIGVKDMGTLLPGHGGVMDRLDSLLTTAPVAYILLASFVSPP
jgi:phosphatidate cytidylyltransferase